MLAFLFFIALIAASLWYQAGGYLHPETSSFLRYLNDDRTFLEQVFDPKHNDWDRYQARELSYAFDWFDARLVLWLSKSGHLWFYQWSHFLASLLIAYFFYGYAKKTWHHLKPLNHALLVGLLLTSPMYFLSGNLFRSSKTMMTLSALLLWIKLSPYLWPRKPETDDHGSAVHSKTLWLCFALATVSGLLDRQGLFMAVGMGALFFTRWIFYREASSLQFLATMAVSCLVIECYNHLIGPWLIMTINHYPADFTYQQIRPLDIFKDRHYYYYAVNLLPDHLAWMFGNIPKVVATYLGLAIFAFVVARSRTKMYVFTSYAVVFVLICTLYALMILRHDAVAWNDTRRIYYWTASTVITLCFMTHFLNSLAEKFPRIIKWLPIALSAALVSNLMAIPKHHWFLENGLLKREVTSYATLRSCIYSGGADTELPLESQKACTWFKEKLSSK